MSIVIPTRINKTSAQWALDTTVYSANKILVTTDVFYGATNQPKFKFADGVKTWAQLDYFPISGYDDAISSIQGQLNAKAAIELMFGTTTTFTPLRLTTYYLTFQTNLAISTTATARQFQGVNLTVFGLWLYVDVQSTLGTTEGVTFNLRNITDATSHLLGTLTFDARGRSKLMDVATPILMNTSKFYSVEMQTPNWGTIPVQNAMLGKLLCR